MSYYQNNDHSPPGGSSGAATPMTTGSTTSSTFLGSSIYSAFGGLMRRLSSDPAGANLTTSSSPRSHGGSHENGHGHGGGQHGQWRSDPSADNSSNGVEGVYNPHINRNKYRRAVSPLRPPPLEPLVLHGYREDTPDSARLMSRSVAEEIRIMVPERLRIEEDWRLIYSLDQDGASLATLYEKCARFRGGRRGGFVLVVRDDDGGTFGAYLTEAPHASPHYFGTGECFLWRASLVASLPPPPSADTTNLGRSTTIAAPTPHAPGARSAAAPPPLIPIYDTDLDTQSTAAYSLHADDDYSEPHLSSSSSHKKQQQPPIPPPSPSVRFKAFPYSGVNEYYVYCEPHWLSVGGGDGKFGLWLDDSLAKGRSATCMTFGNEPLSDEGEKFGVLGVEVWAIGAKD